MDDKLLRYKFLNFFDGDLQHLEEKYGWLHSPQAFVSLANEKDKVIVFERAGLLFIFNFHPTRSYSDYRVGVDVAGKYHVALNTDNQKYGGQGRVKEPGAYFSTDFEWNNRANFLQVYIPCRTALVLSL